MKHVRTKVFGMCTVVFILALAVGLPAQEKRLNKSDLPLAVQKAADEASKGAVVKGYSSEMEKGKLQYEVQLAVNGHSKDVTIARDGTVLEEEEQVKMDALPVAVRDALQRVPARLRGSNPSPNTALS
jgi:hypothetical protein